MKNIRLININLIFYLSMTALFVIAGIVLAFNNSMLSITEALKMIFAPYSSDFIPMATDADRLLRNFYFIVIFVFLISYLVSAFYPKSKLNIVASTIGVMAVLTR